jgi:hypothetical protein
VFAVGAEGGDQRHRCAFDRSWNADLVTQTPLSNT